MAAAGIPKYGRLIDVAVEYGKSKGGSVEEQTNHATDRLVRFFKPIIKLMGDLDWFFVLFYQLVEFGKEILAIVPGRVSTEVDARLSFDKEATKAKVYYTSFVCGIIFHSFVFYI